MVVMAKGMVEDQEKVQAAQAASVQPSCPRSSRVIFPSAYIYSYNFLAEVYVFHFVIFEALPTF